MKTKTQIQKIVGLIAAALLLINQVVPPVLAEVATDSNQATAQSGPVVSVDSSSTAPIPQEQAQATKQPESQFYAGPLSASTQDAQPKAVTTDQTTQSS